MMKSRMIVGMWVLLMAVLAFLPVSAGAGPSPAGGTVAADDGFTPPKPIQSCMVQPVYPEQERVAGVQGIVFLGVEIRIDGTVASVRAVQEVESHPAFTASAKAAVGKWCFEPARQGGKAVACSITVPVRFALDEKKRK
jgi:periplasmic protein TonB